ncbi:MAG: AlkA N-terminal domain-containing protein [Kofleriaceae bacterium]
MNDDARYDALVTRDPRFDGVFFVGVTTTGVYCRPICPARTPGRARCQFYATAALAEQEGFRACLRCRPEIAPGNSDVDAIDSLVADATRRIADGALNDASVDDLAAELGVSSRHLRRATEARLGVSPNELAQTRRLGLAKQLLHDTALPITQIAFAAGFSSVRRFNAAFAERMGSSPTQLRRVREGAGGDGITLRLDVRPPYAWDELVAFLRPRAIPGVESVTDDRYRRVVTLPAASGAIEVGLAPGGCAIVVTLTPSLLPAIMPVVAGVRRMFDLDARPDVIARVLGRDPALAPLIARRPGLRLPGAIAGFEAGVRALLGQQVSVAAATTFAGRLAAAVGTPTGFDPVLTHRFPTAAELVAAGPSRIARIGLTTARAEAIHAFATAVASGALRLDRSWDLDAFVAQAIALPGIGPWTAHYLAMRALHLSDAFPAADLGVRKALGGTPRDAERRAEMWRPFRSYAVMHLWSGGAHVENDDVGVADRSVAAVRTRRRVDRAVPTHPRSRPARSRGDVAGVEPNRAPARAVLRG